MKEKNIPLSDAKFFVWLWSHVYWFQLTQYTLQLYHKLEERSPTIKDLHDRATQDQGISLVEALKEYRKLHFEKAFNLWKGRMRATFDPRTTTTLALYGKETILQVQILTYFDVYKE